MSALCHSKQHMFTRIHVNSHKDLGGLFAILCATNIAI